MFRSSHLSFLVFCHFWQRSYENMKILHILCLHFAQQDGQDGKKQKENYTMKVTETKIQTTKIWVELNKNITFEMIRPCFLSPVDRFPTMDLACVPSIYRVVLAWMEEFARERRRMSCITVGLRSPIFSTATMIFICFTVVCKKVQKIGLYGVKWPQEKQACLSHDDATPLSFQLQVTEDIF